MLRVMVAIDLFIPFRRWETDFARDQSRVMRKITGRRFFKWMSDAAAIMANFEDVF